MTHVLVGLGNPGMEYESTRHNTGARMLEAFRAAAELPKWKFDKKLNSLVSSGKVGTQAVLLLLPQTFMNKSGDTLKKLQTAHYKLQTRNKELPNLVVLHDDLDIPFGSYKISFNKSSGGHKGVESVIKAVKTQAFARVRVGIASSASAVKKSQNDEVVKKTILGTFSADELGTLKKMGKRIALGLTVLVTEGREKAMSQYQG